MDGDMVLQDYVEAVSKLAKSCQHCSDLMKEFHNVSKTVEKIDKETESLTVALNAFSNVFNEPSIHRLAEGINTGFEEQHWTIVRTLMDDCEEILKKLKTIFRNIEGSQNWFVQRTRVAYELLKRSAEMNKYLRLIRGYRHAIELSSQFIVMYVYGIYRLCSLTLFLVLRPNLQLLCLPDPAS
jgi:hypothetical protein